MKRLMLILLISLNAINLIADEYPFVCEWNEISNYADKRYFQSMGSTNDSPVIIFDSQTIVIDKKNKTVKVWRIDLASPQGRKFTENILGKYHDYSEYGYSAILELYDYKNRKIKNLSTIEYKCNGSIIEALNNEGKWKNIAPSTISEKNIETIKQIYKLE